VTAENTHLQLHLDGGPADQHRVSLNDLTTIAQGVQTAVRNVGAVLAGQTTGRGGRKLGWIEEATELVLVAAPREGSVDLDLELAARTPAFEVNAELPDLGPAALEAFVDGLDKLTPDALLPKGFDPGVLKALASMAPVFRKGYKSIGLAVGHNGAARRTTLTQQRLNVARQLTQRPLSAPASVEGVLIAVDLAGDPLACRIDRPFLPSVVCLIPREMREVVRDLVDHQVHVEGIGEFDPGAEEPKRLRVTTLRAAGPGRIDRTAWREHRPWQEQALQQGTEPLRTDELPSLFDDDEDLDRFLAAAHGQITV
jgi:hypothetical protein